MSSAPPGASYGDQVFADRAVERSTSSHVTEARLTAGSALRELAHALVGHEADDALLTSIADTATAARDRLNQGPRRTRAADDMLRDVSGPPPDDGAPLHHYDDCPISGEANPMSIACETARVGSTASMRFTLGPAHEGAPDRAHGGVVAALFDDAMGFLTGGVLCVPVYVVELRTFYYDPIPLGREIEMRAHLVGARGQVLHVHATAELDGRVLAASDGQYVVVDAESAGPPDYEERFSRPSPRRGRHSRP